MRVTNARNRLIYRLWSPFYDAVFDSHFAAPGRRRAIQVLDLQPGECVFLPGVGTGADLPLLPDEIYALGIDYSPTMLRQARRRLPLTGKTIDLLVGDAQSTLVAPGTFDAVVFNLVLSVVPVGNACFRAGLAALKPGGRAVIFDKFFPEGASLRAGRRLFNFITRFFGTDITRRFSEVTAGSDFEVLLDEPSLLSGMYRVILIRYNRS